MNDISVIDRFLIVFSTYIDSGFGLLNGEVAFLTATLVAIDMTLAGLYWALGHATGQGEDVMAKLIRKVLYVGAFAYIIGNFNTLAGIVFRSFAGLGLTASGSSLSMGNFLQPGRLAKVGIDAGAPILEQIKQMAGFPEVFINIMPIVVLFFAWMVVIVSFFVLAVQLFVTLIEFKLTTLAGFVLVPFALWNKTAFLAEKVLGNVVSSGIKVLVLAVIIGIGSTLFAQFTGGFGGAEPTIEDAMTIMLAALSMLGLGIFGPGIANGIVSGGPQLGAGAAAGTALAAGGLAVGAAAGARLAAGAAGSTIAGAASAGVRATGGASAAYRLGSAGKSGAGGVASGLGGVAQAAAGAATSPLRKAAASLKQDFREGGRSAVTNTGGTISGGAPAAAGGSTEPSGPPAWAANMKNRQSLNHGATIAAHTLRAGDGGGAGASVDVSEKD